MGLEKNQLFGTFKVKCIRPIGAELVLNKTYTVWKIMDNLFYCLVERPQDGNEGGWHTWRFERI